MFCNNCGSEIKSGVAFCTNCGARVVPNSSNVGKYKKKYNFGNVLLLLACMAVVVSVFLPFVSVEVESYSESVNLMSSNESWNDGFVVLGLVVVVLIIDMLKLNIGNVICSILMVGMAALEIISIYISEYSQYVEYEIGCRILLIGSAVMLVSSIIGLIIAVNSKKKLSNT
jgi:hypothetical protein